MTTRTTRRPTYNATYVLLAELDRLPALAAQVSWELLGDQATAKSLTALHDVCARIVEACRRTGRLDR